ncbi:MAG: uroporphyrinogen-III synthase [Candidatus Bathyarchaeota archaeon]|nr:uroporphyrinogen-III synthase [Candidatus Bathyarchaeum sp.]
MVQDAFTLNGQTVAITRPHDQAEQTGSLIKRYGAKPYFIPSIQIKPICDSSAVKNFVNELETNQITYILFMSINGVRHLLGCAEKLGLSSQLKDNLNRTIVMAVGPKTAQELTNSDITVGLVPEKYSSTGIIQCLKQRDVSNSLIYIPRTSGAAPDLANKLSNLGATVHELYVYESLLPTDKDLNKKFLKDLKQGLIDAIIFGSSLSAKNLFTMLEPLISKNKLRNILNKKLTIVAIGPVTAKTLLEMDLKVDVTPKTYLFEDALKALAQFWADK